MKRKRRSSSRKTSAGFSVRTKDAILPRSFTAWPKAGLMRGGVCSALTMLELPTNGSGSGSWPTARSTDGRKGGGTRGGDSLPDVAGLTPAEAKTWHTPQVADATKVARNTRQGSLTGQVRGWASPRAERGGADLRVQAWPTPRASPNENRQTKPTPSQLAGTHGMNLATAVNWPTPDAALMNDGEEPKSFLARQAKLAKKHNNSNGAGTPLAMAVKLGPRPPEGLLNPEWVEQLMGWPAGWTLPSDGPPAAPQPSTRGKRRARPGGA